MSINNPIKDISIIIVTWNGIDLLKKYFSYVIQTCQNYPANTEIIIFDNGSTDGTKEWIQQNYTTIKYIYHPTNLGYSKSNNQAVQLAQYENLIFLNNDIMPDLNFIFPLIDAINSPNIFAACPIIFKINQSSIDDGIRYGYYQNGLFDTSLQTDIQSYQKRQTTTFLCGACFCCKKDKFIQLEGFDEIFTPFAWEDLDLSIKAWRSGYQIVCIPESKVWHHREATSKKYFKKNYFLRIVWRNKFIFMWKHLSSWTLIKHFGQLPVKLIKFLMNGRWPYTLGFLEALIYLPKIIYERLKSDYIFSLNEILEKSKNEKLN